MRSIAMLVVFAVVFFSPVFVFVGMTEYNRAQRDTKSRSSARSVESLNNAEARATTERSDEFDTNGGLGTGRKDPAVEATVPPTAGELLAEWLQEIECELKELKAIKYQDEEQFLRYGLLASRSVRIRSYLDANRQAQQESR